MSGGTDKEVVLITGAPSLAARGLTVRVLESEPEARVVLVVLERLLPHVAAQLDELPKEARARVEVLSGDAAAIDLGLSGAEYRELAGRVTRVHHLAAVTFVGADEETARYTNIGGAVEMVELGRAAERLTHIVFHGTAQVSGDRSGLIYEHELDVGQGFFGPVQKSRFEAERVMRRAMNELPIAILRPTHVVGDSVTGEVDRLDGIYLLAMLVLGLPGELDVALPKLRPEPIDVVPVDYVVEAAYAIGRHPDAPGKTFHLTSGEQLTADHLFELIARAGGRRVSERTAFPTQVARALSRTPGLKRLLREPGELIRQLSTGARYDTKNARHVLEPAGICCPPVASYVETWVEAVRSRAG
ncbi:MAG TPA: oxidoreductase [Polyangiaceae bacterium]|nr:oxidoreductase [Polyangiaceae bacterium]